MYNSVYSERLVCLKTVKNLKHNKLHNTWPRSSFSCDKLIKEALHYVPNTF
jgi:hypothetical protein